MTQSEIEPAQHTAAKVAGVLYLVQMAVAIFGESFVRGRLIVAGDATQTAQNISLRTSGSFASLSPATFLFTSALSY